MKKINITLLIVSFIAFSSHSSYAFFEVIDSLFISAIEKSRHGEFEKGSELFKRILKEYPLTSKKKKEIYFWLTTNAKLSGDYKTSYRYQQLHLKENGLTYSRILSELPKQSITKPTTDETIPYYIDSVYYEGEFRGCTIQLSVEISGKKEKFILDNGCSQFCCASESFANSHNIHSIGVTGNAIGVVNKVSMWMGIADSLTVGNLSLKNIIFIVVPDKAIKDAPIKIDAILGANFFRLAGEMQFDNKARTITFPYKQQDKNSNITIDSRGTHYIKAKVNNDSLLMQLDLGATYSELNSNYYKKNRKEIKTTFSKSITHIGGIGGTKNEIVYCTPSLSINCCEGHFIKKNAKVSTKKRPNESFEDGAIGNDFLLYFDKAVINLKKMYLYVK